MSNLPQFVRGNTISFSVTYYDVSGNIVTPDTSTLNISYLVAGAYVSVTPIVMTVASGVWTATWESNVADEGRVDWNAKSGNSTPFCRIDGSFILTANQANPEP